MKLLFVYTLTDDTNFAPCIDNGLFSLACCKGKMRRSAASSMLDGDEVWVLGLCSKALNITAHKNLGDDIDRKYKPLFLSKIKEVPEYEEYFSYDSPYKGRNDQKAYKVENEKIVSNECNPHNGDDEAIEKDKDGKYVLISDHFIYLGSECGKEKTLIENSAPCIFDKIKKTPRGYNKYKDFDFDIERCLSDLTNNMNKANRIKHLSEEIIIIDNSIEKSGCGKKKNQK